VIGDLSVLEDSNRPGHQYVAVHIVVDDDGHINRFVMFEDSWHVSAAMRP
jgi:N-acetyl-anhydromuramyl-L-alanine amidase AmpD